MDTPAIILFCMGFLILESPRFRLVAAMLLRIAAIIVLAPLLVVFVLLIAAGISRALYRRPEIATYLLLRRATCWRTR